MAPDVRPDLGHAAQRRRRRDRRITGLGRAGGSFRPQDVDGRRRGALRAGRRLDLDHPGWRMDPVRVPALLRRLWRRCRGRGRAAADRRIYADATPHHPDQRHGDPGLARNSRGVAHGGNTVAADRLARPGGAGLLAARAGYSDCDYHAGVGALAGIARASCRGAPYRRPGIERAAGIFAAAGHRAGRLCAATGLELRRSVGPAKIVLAHRDRLVRREHRQLRRVPVGPHDRRAADGRVAGAGGPSLRLCQPDRHARPHRVLVPAAMARAAALRRDHGLWHRAFAGRGGAVL